MVICMIFATMLFVGFVFLYLSAGNDITELVLNCCCEKYEEEIKKTQIEMTLLAEKVRKCKNVDAKKYKRQAKKLKKKLQDAQKMLSTYQLRKIAALDLIPVAGYRILQLMKWDAKNQTVKKLYEKCQQYKEKKQAVNHTYYVLGNMFGYIILGIAVALLTIGFSLAMGLGSRSIIVGVAIEAGIGLVGYLPYDTVTQTVKKRREEIEFQFPQLVSQMTLLVVAGMEINKAWNISSKGGSGTLYEEMCRVNLDLENNVPPMEAYGKFIKRCNNKYTTKLVTAIMQNLTKGNAEIAKMFTQLNNESWSEHRHNARRMSEVVQSKLFIPTMLMFAGILIMVIIPLMSGFGL